VEILAFYMDCVEELGILLRLWCRNFHCTGVFVEKLVFYRDFGGELGILTWL
jgi:hypothetical protein